jgi:hypothetical protein
MLTTQRPISTTLCLWSALAAGLLLLTSGPKAVRADDQLEEQRRINAVLAQKFKREAGRILVEALVTARTDPAQAVTALKDLRGRLESDKLLSAEDRQQLVQDVDSYIRKYDRSAARQEEARKNEAARREQEARARREDYRKAQERARVRLDRVRDNVDTMRRIRDERDQRYIRSMREVVRSSIPVEGDISFPADWRKKSQMRLATKLTEEEKKLIKALSAPITTTIKDKPLQGVLETLEKTTGLMFELDQGALEQLMVTGETPVSGSSRGATTRSFIKNLLASVNLTYAIRNGKLVVTTPERASQMLVIKTYYIGDLIAFTGSTFFIGSGVDQLQMIQNIATLIEMIKGIEPSSWQGAGGPGTIVFNPVTMAVIIKQTAEMQYIIQGGGLGGR